MRREVLPDVLEALRQQPCAVLQAPPGAGKTTTVPLAMLLQEPHYLQPQQKILVGWKHTPVCDARLGRCLRLVLTMTCLFVYVKPGTALAAVQACKL
jgi:hypothetical protein